MERTLTETPEGTIAGEYIPPCRQAEVFITTCPLCCREMRVKTLMYSHKCGRSFDPAERAREQQTLAENAIKIRMASIKKPSERPVQHLVEHTQQNVDKKQKYANLIFLLNVCVGVLN